MPVQNSFPARWKISWVRLQVIQNPTSRIPPCGTTADDHLRAFVERGKIMEGEETSRKGGRGPSKLNSLPQSVDILPRISKTMFQGLGEDGEEEKDSMYKEGCEGTEVFPDSV
ncbi:hypothetical protein O181_027104 [Austropuccinia psidii MF-1]|uniref:Uncharacterized protein n=1 Tax=Austropuccinia psidii MF-1 TaxID=1389203 RepID=A0A9Q3H2A2_9BASI|nr:hypothetical protein [Austropuccinia psidii MF-1]